MKIYYITNKDKSIIFEFQFEETVDQLVSFKLTEGLLTEEQYSFLLERFPQRMEHMEAWKKFKKFDVVEQFKEVTFEDFYQKYNHKFNRQRAEKLWYKLSKADQLMAYKYISRYYARMAKGVNPKYPDTYLNNKPWND